MEEEPKLIDKANVKSISHILITDPDTKQVILNKRDVHPTHQKRKTMHDDSGIKVVGHLLITDMDTGEVLAENLNAINFESLSYALALSLADRPNGNIMQMVFGNGASTISAVGTITYLPPNVTGLDAALYNQTYSKFVDDLSPLNISPQDDFIRVNHTLGNTYSDIVVTCLLNYNEPSGQQAFDNAVDASGTYIFDEIGLKTYDVVSSTGYLLSHVIFHPVQKSLNRRIQTIYTLRIIMA